MHEDPWASISADPSLLLGRRYDGVHPLTVYWVRSADGSPGVVFRKIDAGSVPSKLPRFRGVSVVVAEAKEKDQEIRLFLTSPVDREVFSALSLDIVGHSGRMKDSTGATRSVFGRLEHWQHLLSKRVSLEMGPQEIRGLIGELTILSELAKQIGIRSAISAWVAPDDQPQDFALPSKLIEVKTRVSGSRQQIQISSLEQLDLGANPTFLTVVELAPSDADGASSLTDLVRAARADADTYGSDCRDVLDGLLLRRGYLDLEAYAADRYVVASKRAYAVIDDFPSIVRSRTDLRIRQATYVLDLPSIDAFERPFETALSIQIPE